MAASICLAHPAYVPAAARAAQPTRLSPFGTPQGIIPPPLDGSMPLPLPVKVIVTATLIATPAGRTLLAAELASTVTKFIRTQAAQMPWWKGRCQLGGMRHA